MKELAARVASQLPRLPSATRGLHGRPYFKFNQRALQDEMDLSADEAVAIVGYRSVHGAFKSCADLEKVPGDNMAMNERYKDGIVY